MTMRGNLDLAADELFYWIMPAMVAEFQLESLASERDAGELMSQADSEDRLASHQAPNIVDRICAGFGIARSVRQEHSIGLQRQHILGRGLRGDDRHLAAFSSQLPQDVLLDAEVVGDNVKARR